MMKVYFVNGWGGGTKDYMPEDLKSVLFEEIEDGPILGSFIINGELFGLDFLSKDRERPDKTLYAICEEENIRYNNFSNLIPENLLIQEFPEDKVLARIISIKPDMLSSERDLSISLAMLNEGKDSPYWALSFESYLKTLGYDVSIDKGYWAFEEDIEAKQ